MLLNDHIPADGLLSAPFGMDPPILRAEARPSRSLIPNSFPVHSAGTRSDVKDLKVPDLKGVVAEIQSHLSQSERISAGDSEGRSLPELLNHPDHEGMVCDGEMNHLPATTLGTELFPGAC